MKSIFSYLYIMLFTLWAAISLAQQKQISGTVIDLETNEPLIGATIIDAASSQGAVTDVVGKFSIKISEHTTSLEVQYAGYESVVVTDFTSLVTVVLRPSVNALNQVIVSANREKELRSEVPAAISTISSKTIEETGANTLDQVLNKVPGVFVADLNNEQHMTSIRQPITTKGLFLYLEDGLPTRPTGVFNHNAMNEYNQGAIKTMEIIRGPASSTYGAEAIGGVINVITHTPTLTPTARISLRGNTNGLKRTDFRASNSYGKTGIFVGGYYAQRREGYIDHSDMDKYAGTFKLTHAFNAKTDLTASITYANLDTDMTGTLDSAAYYGGDVTSNQTFTERTVSALRTQATLNHSWNLESTTTARVFYRDNSVGQIPSYRVRTRNGVSYGRINERIFNSYGGIVQHKQDLRAIKSKLIVGASLDFSPTKYWEDYILVDRSEEGIYTSYTDIDSALTDNKIDMLNLGTYATFQISPIKAMNLSASIRYDRFSYNHTNYLEPSAYSGSADSKNTFSAFTPKLGLTYNFSKNIGAYANYAQGFVPPQVSSLYGGVKIPTLEPSVYNNYELGGWYGFQLASKLTMNTNVALYQVNATNQEISVQQDDGGNYESKNAGEIRSRGFEYMLSLSYDAQVLFRWSGSVAKHEFIDYVDSGVDYSGNEMAKGARSIYNYELTLKPDFLKGFRLSLENQYMGKYWMDDANTEKYEGFSVFHLRGGYSISGFDISLSVLNLTDELWSPNASKSANGKSYTLGIPRTLQFGLAYHFKSAKD